MLTTPTNFRPELRGILLGAAPLVALPVSAALHVSQPPNSLRPRTVQEQEIQVSHARRRVRSCALQKDRERASCTSQVEDVDSATKLVLLASQEPRSTVDKSQNRVAVEIPHGLGRQMRTIRLRAGEWFIEWPGSPGRTHVTVVRGRNPEIRLTTVTGRCEQKDGKCTLLSHPRLQRIEIVPSAERG